MSDRIDPGPGWRLLVPLVDEQILGDQYLSDGEWHPVTAASWCLVQRFWEPRRRRIPGYAEKAIATRVTVRASFPDGAMISDSIACESGLSMEMMGFFMDRWSSAKAQISTQVSPARYIMLEIQREGEP